MMCYLLNILSQHTYKISQKNRKYVFYTLYLEKVEVTETPNYLSRLSYCMLYSTLLFTQFTNIQYLIFTCLIINPIEISKRTADHDVIYYTSFIENTSFQVSTIGRILTSVPEVVIKLQLTSNALMYKLM